jgi:uncharacterized membrane protein YbhN (UPF0104 family)
MRPAASFAFKFLFACGALWLLFRFVPAARIMDALAGADLFLFAAGLSLQFLNRALATVPMKLIADSQGIVISRRSLYRILLAVQFYAVFLPGALAGGGATWMKYVQHGADKGAAAAAIIVNRGVGSLMLATIGALALLLDPLVGALSRFVALGLIGVSVACLVLVWLPWKPAVLGPVAGSRRLGDFFDRLLRFKRLPARHKAIVMLSMIAQELGNAAAMWIFAQAVGVPVDYVSVVWMRAALQVALMLPVSIAGLGVREASLVGLGTVVGIQAVDAVAWSFTILAGTLGVALAGSFLESGTWLRSGRR